MTEREQLELYNKLSEILPPFIKKMFPSSANDIDDIIHEIFIKVVTKGNYVKEKDISERQSYYTTICKNYLIDKNRKEKSREKYLEYIKLEPNESKDKDYEVEEDYKHELKSILTDLTRIERYIVQKYYVEKKSKKKIRNRLSISRDTLNRYIYKLEVKLHKLITSNDVLKDFIVDNDIQIKEPIKLKTVKPIF